MGFRLLQSLRTRTRNALKGLDKSDSTAKLLGCSMEDFKKHIESQFTDGMSFDNYGEWHLDHIMPCCSFDMRNADQQRKCFHFTNIQPLWAKENLSKGGRVFYE